MAGAEGASPSAVPPPPLFIDEKMPESQPTPKKEEEVEEEPFSRRAGAGLLLSVVLEVGGVFDTDVVLVMIPPFTPFQARKLMSRT
jgi:hypothetical protein